MSHDPPPPTHSEPPPPPPPPHHEPPPPSPHHEPPYQDPTPPDAAPPQYAPPPFSDQYNDFLPHSMARANERTPLVQVVHVRPAQERYSHSTLRRFCTTALGATLIVVVVLFVIPLRFLPPSHHGGGDGTRPWPGRPWPGSGDGRNGGWRDEMDKQQSLALEAPQAPSTLYAPHSSWPSSWGIDPDELLDILMTTPDPDKARKWSEYYTSGPHLAGKNLTQAVQTMEWWQEFGIAANIVAYDVYINYPMGHGLKLMEKDEKRALGAYETTFEATLEEDILEDDPTTSLKDRVMTFHGYSASGNVTAPMVYCNFGTYNDFEDLRAAGVELSGKIALVKYGGIFRGLKVKRAQDLGMVGAIIFSDPQEDGEITEVNGYKPYPDGPARQPSSVQRGSVQFLSVSPGDPTTPGYPSLPGVPRQNVSGAIPSIPSLPLSYKEAIPFLKALNGHGLKATDINDRWLGGGLSHKGVEYNIGPSSAVVNLVNEQSYATTPLWNVIGVINGTIPDEVIVVGNHRDAWIAGGGVDPNSGSAAINELVRSFGAAVKKGWKPQRTIVFGSWDGEEYGLIGSTEWVEEYLPWLSEATVAYVNVDSGAGGPHFHAAASPLLNKLLYGAASKVPSPNQTTPGQTVGDVWDGSIMTMGSGSDFTAFQDFAGIPSVDIGFSQDGKSAVYHYHSNYDSFHWMDSFGDKGWHYHVAITQVWAQALVKLVESPVLPLNATDYALGLARYLDTVRDRAAGSAESTALGADSRIGRALFSPASVVSPLLESTISPSGAWYKSVRDAIDTMLAQSRRFDAHAAHLADRAAAGVPWWNLPKRIRLWRAVRNVNTKLKLLERQFLHQPGLDGRSWFKHVVFAPGLWTGYAGATFPGLVEAIDAGDTESVGRWAGIIESKILGAVALLKID